MIKTLFTSNVLLISILTIGIIFLLIGLTAKKSNEPVEKSKAIASFYDLNATSIDGEKINFNQYKGKKVLIVNTASSCGYTYQYEGLQKLHDLYGENVVVLGFPANDFLYQERGSDSEIADFCEKNYGVTFQMFSKITTKGRNQSPVYTWLTNKDLNGWNEKKPTWNFCKYLVNEEGDLVALVGPSGSGKSSFLHLMGLLDSPTKGKMIIDRISKTDLVLGKSISFDFLLTIDRIENKINKSIIAIII